MQFKIRTLVLAICLAGSGIASADIDNYTTGNGELFFAVYDPVAKVSYALDLPLNGANAAAYSDDADSTFNLNHFLPAGVGAVAGENPPGTVTTPGTEFRWNINTADADWVNFVNGVSAGGSSSAAWKWGVFAGDNTGAQTTPDKIRYLTTIAPGVTKASIEATQTITNLVAFNGTESLFVAAGNSVTPVGDHDFFAAFANGNRYFGIGFEENWKGKASFNATAGFGTAAQFAYLTGRNTGFALATIYQNGATWRLHSPESGQFQLAYTVPVPEVDTWAMFAAGLVMVGTIARRRMKV